MDSAPAAPTGSPPCPLPRPPGPGVPLPRATAQPGPREGLQAGGGGAGPPAPACPRSVGLHYRFPADFARASRLQKVGGEGSASLSLSLGPVWEGRRWGPRNLAGLAPPTNPFTSFWPRARAPISSHLAGAHTLLLPTLTLEFSPTWTSYPSTTNPPPSAHSLVLSFVL